MLFVVLAGAAAMIVALVVASILIKKLPVRIILWALCFLILTGCGVFWFLTEKAAREMEAKLEQEAREEQIRLQTVSLEYNENEIHSGEELEQYPNLEMLDARESELDPAGYEELLKSVPENCVVLWSVPLTDGRFDNDTELLTLPGFNASDLDKLPYFEKLKTVDATGSKGYDALLAFPERFPEVELLYSLPVGSSLLTMEDASFAVPADGDVALLKKMLPLFPALKEIDLTKVPLSVDQILALKEAAPEMALAYRIPVGNASYLYTEEAIDLASSGVLVADELIHAVPLFENLQSADLHGTKLPAGEILKLKETLPELSLSYTAELFGNEYESDIAELDLRNQSVTGEELSDLLRPFTSLETVYIPESAMDESALETVQKEHPETVFVRNVEAFGQIVSNDIEELDITDMKVGTVEYVEEEIAKLPHLKKIIMVDCGLPNEAMGWLQEQHPQTKFVWTVKIGPHTIRTDVLGFSTKNPSRYENKGMSDSYNRSVHTRKRLHPGDLDNLRYCTDLVALDVGHNYLTSADLEVLRYTPHLQILILADNKITDISVLSTLKELRYIELFMTLVEDVSPLIGLPDLVDINVCYMRLKNVDALCQFTQAERLWFSLNNLPKKECLKVVEALPNCECNYTTRYSTQGGWREHERYQWMRSFFTGDTGY